MRQSSVALEEFALYFYVKMDPNPEADRVLHLEIVDNFYEPLYLEVTAPVSLHQSTEAFRKNFLVFPLEGDLGPPGSQIQREADMEVLTPFQWGFRIFALLQVVWSRAPVFRALEHSLL